MQLVFNKGDQKKFYRTVSEQDFATFHGEILHRVISTFSLARDFEWTSRLFFLEMKENNEEGVGTFLTIEHKSPAFEGEEITFIATVESMVKNELTCLLEARVGTRLIAVGTTGQKMLNKEKLTELFTKPT